VDSNGPKDIPLFLLNELIGYFFLQLLCIVQYKIN
jgi:hypothetical protein